MRRKMWIRFLTVALLAGSVLSCKPDKKEDNPVPVDPKSRFIGSWRCNELSKRAGSTSTFDVHIVDSSGSYVLIEDFYALGFNKKAKAIISGDNITIVVPQTLSGISILSASGNLQNATTIKLNYVVDDGNPTKDTCISTLTKQ